MSDPLASKFAYDKMGLNNQNNDKLKNDQAFVSLSTTAAAF